MARYRFVAFALLVVAGLAGGVHTVVAAQSHGARAGAVAETEGSADLAAGPLGDSGWS